MKSTDASQPCYGHVADTIQPNYCASSASPPLEAEDVELVAQVDDAAVVLHRSVAEFVLPRRPRHNSNLRVHLRVQTAGCSNARLCSASLRLRLCFIWLACACNVCASSGSLRFGSQPPPLPLTSSRRAVTSPPMTPCRHVVVPPRRAATSLSVAPSSRLASTCIFAPSSLELILESSCMM